ncbi:MAG: 3-phosphoserine/phosphohydroxythreonine transaminase [Planctomycetota bacterium]|nr:3-phosphoserine/phosphohydroxythreonine transaminase [Planctomycetota bacterium]
MSASATEQRLANFSAGPAVLPVPVLERIRDEILCLPGAGASVMELSHRSKPYIAVQEGAKQRIHRLLGLDDSFEVLFLQGGSRIQFSMVPMNLLGGVSGPGQYILTGSWGKNAVGEAKKVGDTEVIFDAKETNYDRLPQADELSIDPSAAYLHLTSNETIQGVQFQSDFDAGSVPLVCDASSDFMHRPYDMSKYDLIYACAQKNAGPAGVTVVVIKKELLERSQDSLPGYMNYKNHAGADSMWNTPPTFAVYVLGLVAEWLEDTIGGLAAMHEVNKQKAELLYDVLDAYPEFYLGHAQKSDRSLMNVTFRFGNDESQEKFLARAADSGMITLKGHRSVGGIRASIYNAMPVENVQQLASFMSDFAASNA